MWLATIKVEIGLISGPFGEFDWQVLAGSYLFLCGNTLGKLESYLIIKVKGRYEKRFLIF